MNEEVPRDAPNDERAQSSSDDGSVGLLAYGSAGPWDVAIDDATTGAERWFAQIEGPSVYLYFEISSTAIVEDALRFLEGLSASDADPLPGRTPAKNGSLRLGHFGQYSVTLMRDDEYNDRCFLIIGASASPTARLTLTSAEIAPLIKALRQVREDL
jgi:hypothetical protein